MLKVGKLVAKCLVTQCVLGHTQKLSGERLHLILSESEESEFLMANRVASNAWHLRIAHLVISPNWHLNLGIQ